MNTKTLLITAAVIALIVFLYKKAKGAGSSSQFKLAAADWGSKKFTFTHPALGAHTITNPQGQEGSYIPMVHDDDLQLGWTRVPGNKIVVTLLHKTGSVFSEVYVLDLNAKQANYHSELQPVTVTA